MKSVKLLVVLLLELALLNQLVSAQVRVIDNKGTVSTIDASKWVRIGTSNDIYTKYPGNVGIGITTPVATLHNAGSTILGMTTASDVAVAYTVPTTFVDNYSGMVITQKNISPTITLPEPTNKTIGRLFTISNATESTFPLIISGTTFIITPAQSGQFVWNGIAWSLPGTFASSALSIAGDVSGTLGATSVDKLKGTALSISSLTSGDMLKYDGTNWTNWTPNFLALSALSASAPLSYNNTTGTFGITQATTSTNGYLLSNDWNTFNNKQAAISLTTTGTSGNATFSANTLNIPNYTYTLPAATGSTLGGVIVGSGLNVSSGTISTINNGTVTNFSAGDLSPLFTTTEATTTTTPALSFTLTNAGANTILGNNTGASATPSYFAATALPIAGDVSGTLGAVAVNKLKGAALSITSLAANNLLKYDGANWVNWAPNFLTLTSLSATAPLTYNNGTGAFGITQATTSTDGYLSSANWNTFNNKVTSLTAGSSKVTIGGTTTVPTVDVNTANMGTIALATGTAGADVGVSGSPANLGGTLTLNIPDAGAGARGVVNTSAQTFAGAKTFSSAISAPTATNTINGLIVNAGALSGVTGYTQASGNFAQSGAGTFSTGTGAVSINGNATMAATKTLFLAGSTSGTIGLKGNGAVSNYVLTLPGAVGTTGQVLATTDGTGTLGWTTPRALFSATAPLAYNSGTGAFSIALANTSTNGYLSSADWNTFNNKVSFPGFGLTTGKVWGYDAHPTTIAGYGLTDAAPISGSANYIQNQNSAAQTANMWITGSGNFNGSLSGNNVISTGNVGFHNDVYAVNVPNPIWSFGNALGYGLAYYQGTALSVSDAIGFHFGNIASPSFYVSANGNVYSNGTFNGSGAGLTGTAPNLAVGRADGATKLWSVSHPNEYYISNTWDGTYWQLTSNHSSAVNVGHASVATRLDGPAHTNGGDGWWRSDGATGWYNETYGVGIYATEAGNVRTYNNASFIANNITAAGTLTAPTGVFTNVTVNGTLTAPSDIRLKTKVETLTNVLAKLEQLRGVNYEYIDQQKYAKGQQVGVIAQELQKVFPELVRTDDKGFLSVNYSQLTAVLIQAIKEQQQEIDLLKTQMEKVMNKLGMK